MAESPAISVAIPARNEADAIVRTIRSIARARSSDARLEFLVVDDASTPERSAAAALSAAADELLQEPRIDIRVCSLAERVGVPSARNQAAALATAEILFITDAHVRVSPGWDELVFQYLRPDSILAGTVTQAHTNFRGYGCRLVVPFMGTYWNRDPFEPLTPIQVAACPATILHRELFAQLGGYDPGMRVYGAAEPEFSVRAWLHGAEIYSLPQLTVEHRFKPPEERTPFLQETRPFMVHNSIRFGLLYLSRPGSLQMLRYYSRKFPSVFQPALQMVASSNVWERRAELERTQLHSFYWFVERFALKNQIDGPII